MFVDINSILESFKSTNLSICCYIDTRILHIDTIPYDLTVFDANMSVTISPHANIAKTTSMQLFKQKSKGVHTLIIDGQHDSALVDNWISSIERFSGIQTLQINGVHIRENKYNNFKVNDKHIQLSHLTCLQYLRSTHCKVYIPFFMFLANNLSVCPQLRILSMMYGDLIYLCKRLTDFRLERIKELYIYSSDSDGHTTLKDTDLLLRTFPCLKHLLISIRSSRTINRHIESIIEMVLCSLSELLSFQVYVIKVHLKS